MQLDEMLVHYGNGVMYLIKFQPLPLRQTFTMHWVSDGVQSLVYSAAILHQDFSMLFVFIWIQMYRSPVTACIQTFLFPVVQIYVSHFLLGLDVVGLLGGNVSEHAQRQLGVATQQGQVRVGNSDT